VHCSKLYYLYIYYMHCYLGVKNMRHRHPEVLALSDELGVSVDELLIRYAISKELMGVVCYAILFYSILYFSVLLLYIMLCYNISYCTVLNTVEQFVFS
jgi:hypothetical protein